MKGKKRDSILKTFGFLYTIKLYVPKSFTFYTMSIKESEVNLCRKICYVMSNSKDEYLIWWIVCWWNFPDWWIHWVTEECVQLCYLEMFQTSLVLFQLECKSVYICIKIYEEFTDSYLFKRIVIRLRILNRISSQNLNVYF